VKRLPQGDLFPGAPYSDPETSRAAALEIEPQLSRLRSLVLGAVRSCGPHGSTCDELEVRLGIAGNTVRPRLWELRRFGLIEDSGLRRLTRSGRRAVCWCAR
jgi:hypothetical protein